ncbi:hypothetical protein [Novosphingobium aureum]|uniref:hypothetical protein n=1 Tax=Novosphingobium aureum TaxID=2792964 RepID=UPI002B48E735|nr:hypothetical protein [Novosphingobium aureum]
MRSVSKVSLGTIVGGLALAAASPVLAQSDDATLRGGDQNVVDVAKTPVTDLNLDKKEIPQVLIDATVQPYDMTGIGTCQQIRGKVLELAQYIGPDLDLPQEERDRISALTVAKWFVTSFIPFRGLIREISGANDHEKKVQAAIQAGIARRAFLKGIGSTKKCSYPAAPATEADVKRIMAELDKREADGKDGDKKAGKDKDTEQSSTREPAQERTSKGVPIVNQPVVQEIP